MLGGICLVHESETRAAITDRLSSNREYWSHRGQTPTGPLIDRLTTIEAFVRVAEARSFSRAAQRWGRSRAVVSKYVQQLEAHLGVPLLRRTTRSVSLTDAGRTHLDRCHQILGLVDEAEAELRAAHLQPAGMLRVTAPPGFMAVHHAAVITDFLAQQPQIRIELDLTHRMVDLVEERIDIAIRLTRPTDSSLVARRLAPAPLVLVRTPAAALPAHPTELRDHPCILDTNFRFHPRWPFRIDGVSFSVEVDGPVRVNSPLHVRDLVLGGLGIGLVPRMLVADALSDGRLVEILPGTVDAGWSIYAVTSQRRQLSARTRAFIHHLREVLSRPG